MIKSTWLKVSQVILLGLYRKKELFTCMLASQGGKLDSLSHWANLFLLKWRDVTTREVVLGAHKVPFKKINTEFNQRSEISYYCTPQMSNQHLLNQYLFAKMQHLKKNWSWKHRSSHRWLKTTNFMCEHAWHTGTTAYPWGAQAEE